MSARREARARQAPRDDGTPPVVLLLGPLIEVWAVRPTTTKHGLVVCDILTARRRWKAARAAWLDSAGLTAAEGWRLIPDRSAWSVRAVGALARLRRDGLDRRQLPALAAEASEMLATVDLDG